MQSSCLVARSPLHLSSIVYFTKLCKPCVIEGDQRSCPGELQVRRAVWKINPLTIWFFFGFSLSCLYGFSIILRGSQDGASDVAPTESQIFLLEACPDAQSIGFFKPSKLRNKMPPSSNTFRSELTCSKNYLRRAGSGCLLCLLSA